MDLIQVFLMENIKDEIGSRIRIYRKKQHMTLDDLADRIYKSKATVSKYEKGEISIDIVTLYEIASALDVNIGQLLCPQPFCRDDFSSNKIPLFFSGTSRFYGYFYDGRNQSILRMLFETIPDDSETHKVMMYMNFKDYDNYPDCENTYYGTIEHYDAISNIQLVNMHLPMEKASVQILASSLNFSHKWGLWQGFSSRPMMPVATKMLLSRERLAEDDDLIDLLKISREDIRQIKMYNMLTAF